MENREIILNLLKNERLKPSSTFIGHEGEHLCTTLKVTHNNAFDDFKVHLKFENVDKTFLSKSLTYTSGDYYDDFKIPQAILKKGNVLCQLLFLKPLEEAENLENLDEESADNLVIRQSSIVTFNCGAKIATAAEGIDPNIGLIQFITDGDGTKFLSDNGKYYQINNKELLEKINNKQEKLTAGENIIIDENNIISAAGSTPTTKPMKFVDGLPSDADTNAIYLVPNTNIVPNFSQYDHSKKVGITLNYDVYTMCVFDVSNDNFYNASGALALPYIAFTCRQGDEEWTPYQNGASFNDKNWTTLLNVKSNTSSKKYSNMVYGNSTFGYANNTYTAYTPTVMNKTFNEYGQPINPVGNVYNYKTYSFENGFWVNKGNTYVEKLITNSFSNMATKEYVEQEIANFDFIKIVTELPETGLINRTYFVPKTNAGTNDLYDEYMWINDKWELISTKQIEVDLSQYYTKTQINNIVNEIQSKIINNDDITDIESFELADNTEYRFKQELSSIAFTIPVATSDDYITSIIFKSGAIATTITYPDTIKWAGDDISSDKFVPVSSKTYEVLIYWNGINYCGIVKRW